jgi:hypothetical protein
MNLIMLFYLSILKEIVCLKMKFSNRSELEKKYSQFHTSINEERLLKHLFNNYNPNVIPRFVNESLTIYIGLSMSQLINIVN